MNMKKLMAILLSGMLLFSACGKKNDMAKYFDGKFSKYKITSSCGEEDFYFWSRKSNEETFHIDRIEIEEQLTFLTYIPEVDPSNDVQVKLKYSASQDVKILTYVVKERDIEDWDKGMAKQKFEKTLPAGDDATTSFLLATNTQTPGKYVLVFTTEDSNVQGFCSFELTKASANPDYDETLVKKPVIYLYPEQEMDVKVKLDVEGDLRCTYPRYDLDQGWRVRATPDGTLFNYANGRHYDYLFWEGNMDPDFATFEEAACIPGCETEMFLEKYLTDVGLTESEIDDFISYWLPQMQYNKFNLISFPSAAYSEKALLHVTPEPDSELRVFMCYKALDIPVECHMQAPEKVERDGFTVVEWGGCEIK
jgi:hypothetical protein